VTCLRIGGDVEAGGQKKDIF
jgi:hypothetical protein